jgi:hypothetical protein
MPKYYCPGFETGESDVIPGDHWILIVFHSKVRIRYQREIGVRLEFIA